MTSRGPVTFKLHIDHLQNADGDVWALQYKHRYFTLKSVECFVPLHTVFLGVDAKQPRAYLTGHGRITIDTDLQTAVIAYE